MRSERIENLVRVLFAVLLWLAPGQARGEHVQVFVADGQSNMTGALMNRLEQLIDASLGGEPWRLLRIQHPNTQLAEWVGHGDYVRSALYQEDFKNSEGTGKLEALLAELELEGHTWEFAGFFWMQGENDTISLGNSAVYLPKLRYFINAIREDFGTPELPVIIGKIWILTEDENRIQRIDNVRSAQEEAAATDPYAIAVESSDLPRFSDNVHITIPGSGALAERMFASYGTVGWRTAHFTSEELAVLESDGAQWSAAADPDGDGVSNGIEDAFDTDPKSAGSKPRYFLENNVLGFEIPNQRVGMRYTVQVHTAGEWADLTSFRRESVALVTRDAVPFEVVDSGTRSLLDEVIAGGAESELFRIVVSPN